MRWSRPDGPPPCGLGLDVERAPGHALVVVDVDDPRLVVHCLNDLPLQWPEDLAGGSDDLIGWQAGR
jgi:hypothetical protein